MMLSSKNDDEIENWRWCLFDIQVPPNDAHVPNDSSPNDAQVADIQVVDENLSWRKVKAQVGNC